LAIQPRYLTLKEQTVKAIEFKETGNLNHLQLCDLQTPKPQANEVLIKVLAAGLNKSDTTNVLGLFPYTTVPRVPGRDFAGIVEDGPKELIGLEVFGTGKEIGFTQNGSHAQYLCVQKDCFSIKPPNISFEQAAACGVPFITAYFAIENTRVDANTKVVVIGASGSVGFAAIQLTRQKGAQVLCLIRDELKARQLQQKGYTTQLINETSTIKSVVLEHFKEGADVIFDTTGMWIAQSVHALANQGRLSCIVVPGDGNVNLSIRDLYRVAGEIIGVNSLLYSAKACAKVFDLLGPSFANASLIAPETLDTYALSEAPELYQALRKGKKGKFILLPHTNP
jgi:NADPH:quinone reductase-like Zn-dependent oxidoreductase